CRSISSETVCARQWTHARAPPCKLAGAGDMSHDLSNMSVESVLPEDALVHPPRHIVRAAALPDPGVEYARSIADPEAFWAAEAEQYEWFRRWDTVYQRDYPSFRWFDGARVNITVNALDRHAHGARANKVAYIAVGEDGSERVVTYRQLLRLVNRFANALRAEGVNAGERVVIYMPLSLEGIIAMLACARIGAVHSVVYAGLGAGALRDRIEDADARLVITADVGYRRGRAIDLKAIVDEAIAGLAQVRRVIVWRREPAGAGLISALERDFHELMDGASPELDAVPVDAEHPLYILYTSGTTGKPKGVVHVHGGYMVGTAYHMRTFWDVREDDVFWCMSDIGWVVGHSYIVYAPLVTGTTTLFREGSIDHPHTAIVYEVLEKHGVSVVFTAPTAVRMLMKFGDAAPARYDLRALRLLTCAGEPLNPEAWRWAYRCLCGNGAHGWMIDNYWQTELGGPTIATLPVMAAKPGSAGKPLAGVIADIVDREGRSLPDGTGGLLVLRSTFPHMFRSVHNDPERYERDWSIVPGVYTTGDVALRDADGYITVLGRADDVINVAGHRIGTAEVESALVSHPKVAEAAVIGKPDEIRGQAIKAFVTLRAGNAPDEETRQALVAHVRAVIGPIASPTDIEFRERLPKTRSGKIMRRLLKAEELGVDPGDVTTLEE
ncbi:MAG TPA: acetate--CoA ligase, partial [Thermomicrobiales bacterium]|nr:acetate--CoA ligase [Thermomicrobiales bacterium]